MFSNSKKKKIGGRADFDEVKNLKQSYDFD
jgi:hypothetical protein